MDTILQLVHALGMAALPVIVGWVGVHVKNAFAAQAIDRAVARAGGIAYHYMAARAGGMPPAQARVQAIEVATDYVMRAVPGILTHLGVTNATVRDMVTGELGKLFATDPTIGVVATVPVAPPAQPAPAAQRGGPDGYGALPPPAQAVVQRPQVPLPMAPAPVEPDPSVE